MHKSFVRREHLVGHHEICRRCGDPIIEVPEIGWVDLRAGGSYDLCAGDPYGNHQPTFARELVEFVPLRGAPHR